MRRKIGGCFAMALVLAVGGWAQSGGNKDKSPTPKGKIEKPVKPAAMGTAGGKVSGTVVDSARTDSLRTVRVEQWRAQMEMQRNRMREQVLAGLAPHQQARYEESERNRERHARARDSLNRAYMAEVRQRAKVEKAKPATPAKAVQREKK